MTTLCLRCKSLAMGKTSPEAVVRSRSLLRRWEKSASELMTLASCTALWMTATPGQTRTVRGD